MRAGNAHGDMLDAARAVMSRSGPGRLTIEAVPDGMRVRHLMRVPPACTAHRRATVNRILQMIERPEPQE